MGWNDPGEPWSWAKIGGRGVVTSLGDVLLDVDFLRGSGFGRASVRFRGQKLPNPVVKGWLHYSVQMRELLSRSGTTGDETRPSGRSGDSLTSLVFSLTGREVLVDQSESRRVEGTS